MYTKADLYGINGRTAVPAGAKFNGCTALWAYAETVSAGASENEEGLL